MHVHTHSLSYNYNYIEFISGQQQSMTDSDWPEDIPYSMEVGLLGTVRKVITLMPDNKVRRVVGYVVQHEALIALAHNKSIVFRTAVVRVSMMLYV